MTVCTPDMHHTHKTHTHTDTDTDAGTDTNTKRTGEHLSDLGNVFGHDHLGELDDEEDGERESHEPPRPLVCSHRVSTHKASKVHDDVVGNELRHGGDVELVDEREVHHHQLPATRRTEGAD